MLTEPWIPAQTPDRKIQEYGILDLLANAHILEAVVDPAPPIEFGLYRLLTAFLMDVLSPAGVEDLGKYLALEHFDVDRFKRSVDQDRFDLFHEQHPFLQTGNVPINATSTKSVATLFFHLPTGTNVTHFRHGRTADHAVAPAVCARALCSIAPFMTAGGAGYSPSINGAPPWYILVRGRTLFHTLLLNLYVATSQGKTGIPPWRIDQSLVSKAARPCRSLIDGLTWRARVVRLLPSESGICTYSGQPSSVLVRRIAFAPGAKHVGENWTDPHVAYAFSNKGRWAVRPREDRELWRDIGPLLLLREGDVGSEAKVRFSRPLVVDQLRILQRKKWVSPGIEEVFEVYGMRTDQAKVLEWQHEQLTLPTGVGLNPFAGSQVQDAIDRATAVAFALRRALKQAHPRSGQGNSKALDRTGKQAQLIFWSRLQREFLRWFLRVLSMQDPDDRDAEATLVTLWNHRLRIEGQRALELTLGSLDVNAKALARQQIAYHEFSKAVHRLLDLPQPDDKKARLRRTGS